MRNVKYLTSQELKVQATVKIEFPLLKSGLI